MPSESAWKQVVGKKISESAYVTEEGSREGYLKAMEETCFTKTATNGGCADGVNCQRLVSEEELPNLLAHGWKFVATLPSGKCVVSSD